MDDRNRLGALGEDLAARFLTRKGAKIAARNVIVPEGELDIIAIIAGQRVAIEVRSRWGEDPLDAFDLTKLDRVRRSASATRPRCTRVDLIAVQFDRRGVGIRWIPEA